MDENEEQTVKTRYQSKRFAAIPDHAQPGDVTFETTEADGVLESKIVHVEPNKDEMIRFTMNSYLERVAIKRDKRTRFFAFRIAFGGMTLTVK